MRWLVGVLLLSFFTLACHRAQPYPKEVDVDSPSTVYVKILSPTSDIILTSPIDITGTAKAYALVPVDDQGNVFPDSTNYTFKPIFLKEVKLKVDSETFGDGVLGTLEIASSTADEIVYNWRVTLDPAKYCTGRHTAFVRVVDEGNSYADDSITFYVPKDQGVRINQIASSTVATSDINVILNIFPGDTFEVSGTSYVGAPKTLYRTYLWLDSPDNEISLDNFTNWTATLTRAEDDKGYHKLCSVVENDCREKSEFCITYSFVEASCATTIVISRPEEDAPALESTETIDPSKHILSGPVPAGYIYGTVYDPNCTLTTVQYQVDGGDWYDLAFTSAASDNWTWYNPSVFETARYRSYIEPTAVYPPDSPRAGEVMYGYPHLIRIRAIARDLNGNYAATVANRFIYFRNFFQAEITSPVAPPDSSRPISLTSSTFEIAGTFYSDYLTPTACSDAASNGINTACKIEVCFDTVEPGSSSCVLKDLQSEANYDFSSHTWSFNYNVTWNDDSNHLIVLFFYDAMGREPYEDFFYYRYLLVARRF